MERIVTFEIAELARERGFKEPTVWKQTKHGNIAHNIVTQVGGSSFIDKKDERDDALPLPSYHQLIDWVFMYVYTGGRTKKEHIVWLEFWHTTLKDCPLKYEFMGRLKEWFDIHKGIIETFKILKDEYIK